jgi:hypothetical protein
MNMFKNYKLSVWEVLPMRRLLVATLILPGPQFAPSDLQGMTRHQ